jgi:hypothetical protein
MVGNMRDAKPRKKGAQALAPLAKDLIVGIIVRIRDSIGKHWTSCKSPKSLNPKSKIQNPKLEIVNVCASERESWHLQWEGFTFE